MEITLNKKVVDVKQDITLHDLLEERGYLKPGIAAAVDNNVIKRASWPDFVLHEGASVTVISAVCGG